jgi:hypothetical protein
VVTLSREPPPDDAGEASEGSSHQPPSFGSKRSSKSPEQKKRTSSSEAKSHRIREDSSPSSSLPPSPPYFPPPPTIRNFSSCLTKDGGDELGLDFTPRLKVDAPPSTPQELTDSKKGTPRWSSRDKTPERLSRRGKEDGQAEDDESDSRKTPRGRKRSDTPRGIASGLAHSLKIEPLVQERSRDREKSREPRNKDKEKEKEKEKEKAKEKEKDKDRSPECRKHRRRVQSIDSPAATRKLTEGKTTDDVPHKDTFLSPTNEKARKRMSMGSTRRRDLEKTKNTPSREDREGGLGTNRFVPKALALDVDRDARTRKK